MRTLFLSTLLFTGTYQFLCRIQQSQAQQAVVESGKKAAEFEEAPERRQFCKWPCKCPRKPLCAPGVSLVTDGCGCCKACAKQFGELCTEADTCDPHKDLYCDYSGDRPKYEFGVCSYTVGVGCDLNGILYRHGQTFQPHCHYKCTCVNGVLGCTPTCTKKLSTGQCKNVKIIKRTEYCCEKSLCDKTGGKTVQAFAHRVMSVYKARAVVWRKKCMLQTTPWSACSKPCDMGISVRVTNDNSRKTRSAYNHSSTPSPKDFLSLVAQAEVTGQHSVVHALILVVAFPIKKRL
ncbi:cellular communication network factor 6 isoform X2 [Amblyraja radiata]|uniref:cellular communication network factor 6 isoform X2 n=1 Tax=Amblyraja radiata TaxID=386614 RepID=UPI0014037B9F|nr:cellular communication network factor 6 isoform X2 [Amblyraja radiata]